MIDASRSDQIIVPPASVLTGLTMAPAMTLTSEPWASQLTAEIAERCQVGEGNVWMANGSDAIIETLAYMFRGPAMVLAPTFDRLVLANRRFGNAVRIEWHGATEPDWSRVLARVTKELPASLWLCNPVGSLAQLIDTEILDQLWQVCVKASVRLIIDEAFIELVPGAESFASHTADRPNLFVLKTFSKAYGLPGIRLGYACMHSSHRAALDALTVKFKVSNISYVVGLRAMRIGNYWAQQAADLCAHRSIFAATLRNKPNSSFDLHESEALPFVCLRSTTSLPERLNGVGVKTRDLSFPGLVGGDYIVRISIDHPVVEAMDDLIEAIARL